MDLRSETEIPTIQHPNAHGAEETHSQSRRLLKLPLSSRYDVLPTRTSFRLLDLEPNPSGDSQAELICRLHTYDLEDAPSFKALSYTWGPPYRDAITGEVDKEPDDNQRHVSCNGSAFTITNNLFYALSTLREVKVTGRFWIDALCINQKDLREREAQVLLMGKIYSSASEVLVWLGPPRFGLDDLVWATTDFLTALSNVGQEFESSGRNPAELYKTSNLGDSTWHRTLGIENPIPRLIRLAQFCASCRWFSRAWIIQEFLLARNARAFSGQIELSLSRLGELAWILRVTGWGPLISQLIAKHKNLKVFAWLEEPLRWHIFMNATRRRVKTLAQSGSAEEEVAFEWFRNTLSLSRCASCRDKRDHVYSVLGLVDQHFLNTPITRHIKPNYDISVADLLILTTIKLFEHSRYIDTILSDVENHPENAHLLKLPSWVPNYCLPIFKTQPLLVLGDGSAFDATLCSSYGRSERALSPTTLTCLGAFLGKVQIVHKLETPRTSGVQSLLEFCLSLPQQANGQRRLEVFWRTLIADTTSEGQYPAPSSAENGFLAHTKVLFVQWVLESAGSDQSMDPMEAFRELHSVLSQLGFSDEVDQQLTVEDMKDYYNQLKKQQRLQDEKKRVVAGDTNAAIKTAMSYAHAEGRVSQGRELFMTGQGFLGLGPKTIQEGDQVWLLSDSRVPFVLRPFAETASFTLIGECYIHGIMRGEMLVDPWKLKEKFRPVDIV